MTLETHPTFFLHWCLPQPGNLGTSQKLLLEKRPPMVRVEIPILPLWHNQIMPLFSLKSFKEGSCFLQNGVQTPLPVIRGPLPWVLGSHPQLFSQEALPRNSHRRNSVPRTCHSLGPSWAVPPYPSCELFSQVRCPHFALHWLNPVHPSNPCEIQGHYEKFFLWNSVAFSVSNTYLVCSIFCFLLLLVW